jgi:hypothetical protein
MRLLRVVLTFVEHRPAFGRGLGQWGGQGSDGTQVQLLQMAFPTIPSASPHQSFQVTSTFPIEQLAAELQVDDATRCLALACRRTQIPMVDTEASRLNRVLSLDCVAFRH